MKNTNKVLNPALTWALLLAAGLILGGCGKKEAAEEKPVEAAASAPTAAADTAPAKAEPAESSEKAANSRLLDVTYTGDAYIAVGERGHIVRSTDGKTWTQSPSPVRSALTTVFFADANNGWAGGHDASILGTTDGGKTWKLLHWAPELNVPVLDILFLDTQRGIAVGAYGFYRMTADGGATWSETENAAAADEYHFNGITRLADGGLLLVGEAGGVAYSKDQGVTWTPMASPYEGTFFGALPHGPAGAILYGLRGNVFVLDTVAGAAPASWRKLETGTYQSMLGAARLADGNIIFVGTAGAIMTGSVISLRPIKNPDRITLSAVLPLASGGVMAVGDKGAQLLSLQ